MDSFMDMIASGKPVLVQHQIKPESAAYISAGIFLAIFLGFLVGARLFK